MEKYGVSGETKEKAVRFFLGAAQYAGIQVSRHLTAASSSAPRRKPTVPRRSPSNDQSADASTPPPAPSTTNSNGGGESRAITLASGATLTLIASAGFMKLSKAERDLVFGIIDKFDEYEAKNPSNGGDSGDDENE
jgi:hypothetical protein